MHETQLLGGKMQIKTTSIGDLLSDPRNARKHSARNIKAISSSLEKFGQRKPIVVHRGMVIAGNGTLEAAKQLGWDEITITEVPEDWDADTATAYALADNRTAELAEWDDAVLAAQLLELQDKDWEIADLGFEQKEADALNDETDESKYTNAVNIPQYEITGSEPDLSELYSSTKADELKAEIRQASLPSEVAEFLTLAANRHVVFNYKKIAEFYPHATPEVQRLMEQSALVIIDVKEAIKQGYANFLVAIDELESLDAE